MDNREVMVPLHDLHGLDLGFSFRALSHVSRYALFSLPVWIRLFNCILLASWCA